MKLIGIIGGTSWPSTLSYYEELNKGIHSNLKGFHSARILLYSIDYHVIKSNYGVDFQKITDELEKEILFFMEKKPDCLIIANNTLHKAYDIISSKLNLQIPMFHAGTLASEFAVQNNYKNVLLMGTKFTMEDGFFANYFANRGINVIIPSEEDRNKIGDFQAKIASGIKDDTFFAEFAKIINRYNANAVCLACTELPLYITPSSSPLPVINPSVLQINAAIKFVI